MFDVLIINGNIVDGTGRSSYISDLGIKDGKIVAIGDLSASSAEKTIDAKGLVVAPGFIDIHTHSDMTHLIDPRAESQIRQGVTTEVIGQCGDGPTHGGPAGAESVEGGVGRRGWRDKEEKKAEKIEEYDRSSGTDRRRSSGIAVSVNGPYGSEVCDAPLLAETGRVRLLLPSLLAVGGRCWFEVFLVQQRAVLLGDLVLGNRLGEDGRRSFPDLLEHRPGPVTVFFEKIIFDK